MRALVTGATGFVGSHILARLIGRGAEVAILRRAGGDPWRIRHLLPRVAQLVGGLSDADELAEPIAAFAPEVVLHLAWGGVDRRRREDAGQHRANVEGSLRLLRIAAEAGCRTWIGLGSQAEYGPQDRVLDEAAPTSPRDHYGAAKVEACNRSIALCESLGVRFVWLRLFSAYGPADSPTALIPYTISALLRGERPALTPGTQLWDYLYADDAAEAIIVAAATAGVEGIFNLGSGQSLPIREILEIIRDRIDPTLPLGFGDRAFGPGQIMHLQADVGRLARATGWRPRTPLDEGLARTVAWYRRRLRPHAPGAASSRRGPQTRRVEMEIDR
jgi:nucleoside-diphosphate-sugar epimerase